MQYPYNPDLSVPYRTTQTAESKTIWYAIGRLEQYQAVLETPSDTDCDQELENLDALIVDLKHIGQRCTQNQSNGWEVYSLVSQWQGWNNVTPNPIVEHILSILKDAQDKLVEASNVQQ